MKEMERLLALMARLRDPQRGCPWDRRQNFASIAPYTLEEAYEVIEAIEGGDFPALREELGDLLFQVVFHARMAEEQGHFDFAAVAAAIGDKLVARHPHVFGEADCTDEETLQRDWERRKGSERAARGAGGTLNGVPLALPALSRAFKLQQRAAHAGFDWPAPAPVFAKVREELAELEAAAQDGDAPGIAAELGDLLFAVVNLGRKLGVDAEQALRGANRKFERRFQRVEAELARRGRRPEQASLEEMDGIWEQAKREGL